MIRLFGGFLGFLAWFWLVVSAAVIGYVLIDYAKFDATYAEELLQSWQNVTIAITTLAVLMVLAVLILWARLAALRTRKEIVYANSMGEVSISLAAIEEALERMLDKNDIIKSHEVHITSDPSSKKLVIKTKVFILEVNKVTVKGNEIQQELAKRFEEIMPDTETPEIKVKIVNFSDRTRPAPQPRETAPAEQENTTDETDYFTGLKYPIDNGEEEEQ